MRAAGGVSRSRAGSLARWLARSCAPFPGGESGPGCGRGRVRERSVPEREGRPARWARTSLGGRAAGAERGGGPRRVGGRDRGRCSPELSRAARAGAARPALLLAAGEVSCAGTWRRCSGGRGRPGTSHALHGRRAEPAAGARRRGVGWGRAAAGGAEGAAAVPAEAGWGWSPALPCAALFISPAAAPAEEPPPQLRAVVRSRLSDGADLPPS